MNIAEIDISLKIIKKTKPLSYKIILIYWIVGFLGIFIIPIFGFENVPKIVRYITACVFGSSTIIWWFGNVMIKKHIEIGYFVLANKSLKIYQNNDIKAFSLSEIGELKFRISGCEGDSYGIFVGSVRINEGIDNILSFKNKEKLYKYNFYLENTSQLNFLKMKVKFLAENNYSIITRQ